MVTLAEMIKGNIFEGSEERLEEDKSAQHRHKDMERPKHEVELMSLSEEDPKPRRSSKDPVDLITLPISENKWEIIDNLIPTITAPAYAVYCDWTREGWFCKDKTNLNMNFIYREDLDIVEINSKDDLLNFYNEKLATLNDGIMPKRTCWILDNPANESYEVYHESNMPSVKYGKATPNGMFIHKYDNRFYRDMAILELDDLYSNQSSKKAGKLISKGYASNEAIIVSDGAWMKNSCSSAFVYLDKATVVKQTIGHLPSEIEQAVLISEIVGATEALKMCQRNHKKSIKYYYDNTSILNVFRNRKTEYIQEIKEYKELLEDMNSNGYKIEFIELHPKTGEDRENDNRALMFFHNLCDHECRDMADLYTKDYKDIATNQSRDGKDFGTVKKELQKNSPNNKKNNGGNKYGKRF